MQKLVRFAGFKDYGIDYSRQHISRRVKAGTFPPPVRLGRGCTAWIEEDLLEFKRRAIAERDAHSTTWRDAGGTYAAPSA